MGKSILHVSCCTFVLFLPKRGRSKRGRAQKHKQTSGKRAQMSTKERKRKSVNERERAQKGAKECKRALLCKNCKQPGLKLPGLGTPNYNGTVHRVLLSESPEKG